MSAHDLALEALRLDLSERAELAQRILDSLEELPAAELEKLWANEAQRRDRAMDQGQLSSVSASDVMARLRDEIG